MVVTWSGFPQLLSPQTRDLLTEPDHEVFISAATTWELSIKIAKGNLQMPDSFAENLIADGFKALSITCEHTIRAAALPRLHEDPFDRMLIAQAQCEGLQLMTADRHLKRYDVAVIDA